MPNWQPNWQNVQWDWGAASAASSALRNAAGRLDSTVDQRVTVARTAQVEWRGVHRDRFDHELAHMLSQERGLAAEFRNAAARIDDASNRAAEEQRRRERDRERWQREKREEEERERRRQEEERRKKKN